MKKWLVLSGILLFLSGCASTETVQTLAEPVPDQALSQKTEGISLKLIEDDFDGSPATIKTIVRNETDKALQIGPFYHIELYKEGQWHIITYSDAVFLRDPRFRDGGLSLDAHSEIQ